MMAGNQKVMSRSLKRKIIIDGENLSETETSQGTAKKKANYCTSTALSCTEETEEIKIVFESNEVNSEEKYFELDTSKYKYEFLKHPFIPTMRKRNIRYTRNDKIIYNLTIQDAKEGLLHSETALSDPGDIIQLTEYQVSNSEIECYRRIKAGGLSRKLISRRHEQNLKKKYTLQHELCIVHQPFKLMYPSVLSVITENSNVPSYLKTEILSDSVRGNVNFDDDSLDSSTGSIISQKSKNSHNCSAINNGGNRLDIPLSSDKFSFNFINSNYDSMINATDVNLQRIASGCSSLLGEDILDITNFIGTQQTTANEDSSISSHFHTTSNDITMNKSISTLSNSKSKENTVTYNLQPNSPVRSSVPDDEMQNGFKNGTKSIPTDKVYDNSRDFCTNIAVNCLNEIAVPFDELQKVLDTIRNNSDSGKSSQNNSAQFFLNTVANSCVTNESTSALTNLPSSYTIYYPNEINVPYEELQKAVDTIKKVFGSDVGCQNEIVSVENNVQHFINTGSEEYVGIKTIKSPSPIAAEENSDDEYEDFEPFYNDTDIESNSLVSSGRNSLLSSEDMGEQELVATENINLLPDKEHNKIPFYINDKGMEIEKIKYGGFQYGIIDSETNSCEFNESLTKSENFFCKNNLEKDATTEVSKELSKGISGEKKDDLNLLRPEKLTDNSTPKEIIEATKDSNGKETDDLNLLESEKPIESSISKETVGDANSAENKMSQPFYGNRVSNRGTFLTQKCPMKPPSKSNISNRKTFEVNRNLNTNPEELHALIKTPDINIDLSRLHLHGNRYKCIDSNRNGPLKGLGISSHSDLRLKSVEDKQNTPRKFHCQVNAENNVTKQNTCLPHAAISTTSSVSINNNMPVQSTVLNAYVPPTNFMPRTVTHLNSLSVSSDHRTSEHNVNRFPCFPLAPIYAVQHPFQPYGSTRIRSPIHPLQFQTYMYPRFLPAVHPPQLAFQTYVDARTQDGSSMFHNSFNSVSEKESNNEDSKNYTPPTYTTCSQSAPVMLSPNAPCDTPMPVTSSFVNDVSSKSLDKETEALEIQHVSKRNYFSKTSSNSDISSSSPFKTVVEHTGEFLGKPKCLVPSHMKHYIGSKIFKTEDVRLLILEWNVDSIIHHKNNKESSPIFCNLKKVTKLYEYFEDYYNTFFPLLLLETWQRVYTSLSRLDVTKPFSAEIVSYSMEKDHVIVKCKTVYNTDPDSLPEVGNIVIVNYGTKSNEHTVKIFGYLIQSKLRRFDPETDSETCKYYPQYADTESYTLPVLTCTFIVAYDSEHINKQLPMRIQVLYALKYNLKQHDALSFVKHSPFKNYILKPRGLLNFSLNSENSDEEIRKCVEEVTEKVLSPHPIPVISIIKTNTDSDHLKIIPLLIQRIKNNCSNMKVLVCVRTRGTIADIAYKLISQKDLKFIIVCKRCNINPKFGKFLFEDLVKKKVRYIKEMQVEKKVVKEETFKIKKAIVLDSDVVISWARDIHNDIIAQAFSEAKSIDNMCCIVDEAHSFTEPETLIPTLYGISKMILIGNTDRKPKVLSETAITYDFDKSYLHRAYDPDTSPD